MFKHQLIEFTMKLNDFFDFCISKYQELENCLKIATKKHQDFSDIILPSGCKHTSSSKEDWGETFRVCFDVGCGKLQMFIGYCEHEYTLDYGLCFMPKGGRKDVVEFWADKLESKKERNKLKKELGMYFDDGEYVISIEAMNDLSSYKGEHESGLTGLCYNTREEAIGEARKIAEKLSKKYKRCHYVKVCHGVVHHKYEPITGNDSDCYIISSKSKSESIRATRISGYGNYNADEYVGKEPEIDKSNTIIVMSVFSGEEDEFNAPAELKRYNSLLAVETSIEKHIDEWLEKNEYTLNPEEAEYGYLSYAEMEDDGEEIYAVHSESKTELRIIRKEFKL